MGVCSCKISLFLLSNKMVSIGSTFCCIFLTDKVSNLLVAPTPSALVYPDHKPRLVIGNLSRHLQSPEEASEEVEITMYIG